MAALGNRHREALLLLSKGNTIVKLFGNTSNVRRGAREAGLTNFAIVEVDGKFGFESAHPMTASEFAAVSVPAPAPISSITANAMRALTGVYESKPEPPKAPKAKPVAKAPAKAARKAQAPARGTRNAQLFAMITKGATTAEIADAFGWLPHTTRGALSRFCQQHDVQKTKLPSAAAIIFVVARARSTKLME